MIRNSVVFFLLGWLFIYVPVFGQISDPPYKKHLLEVEGLLRQGKMQNAIGILDSLSVKYPTDAELPYGKAILLSQIGDINSAIESTKKAFFIDKGLVYGNFLTELYLKSNDIESAILTLGVLRNTHPKITAVSRHLIGLLFEKDQIEQALKIYSEEKSFGNHSDTLDVILAEAYIAKKQFSEAKGLLLDWVDKSSLPQVYSGLSFIYIEEKKNKDAIAVLNKGYDKTKNPVLYLELADAYRADNNKRLAFESLKKAFASDQVAFEDKYRILNSVRIPTANYFTDTEIQTLTNSLVLVHPRIAESHLLKGEVLWQRGNGEEAKSLFLTAIGINPRHIDAWRLLINVDLSLGHTDEAIKHGKEALSVNPGNNILMYFTGVALLIKKDHENARILLEKTLDNSEQENDFFKSLVYNSLGDLYNVLKMHEASDIAYEESIALDSTNVSAMNNLAYYLALRKENLEKAAAHSLRSNQLEPNSPTMQDTYAWVLFQMGNYKEALVWIEKAVKGSVSPSAVLFEHYGDILSKLGKNKEAIKQWQKALLSAEGNVVEKLKIKIDKKSYVE